MIIICDQWCDIITVEKGVIVHHSFVIHDHDDDDDRHIHIYFGLVIQICSQSN